MSNSSYVFDVTEQDFATKVVEKSKATPVVVDFWAPWCGPCRMLAPLLESQAAERKGSVLVAKVNTDEQQNLAMRYNIDSLPTVIAFRDGQPFLDFVGLLGEADLRTFFDRLAPSAADKQTSEAAQLETTDPARAEQLYRAALQSDPRLESAMLGLARLLIQRNLDAEAALVVENVGADGANGIEAERLKAIMWLKQKASACADAPVLRARRDAEPKNGQVRYELGLRAAYAGDYGAALELLLSAGELDPKLASGAVREAMVKVFHVVGVRSSLADEYRAKLSGLLY